MTVSQQFSQVAYLLQHRRVREAEQAARKFLAANPEHARGHALLALALTAQDKSREAVHEAQKAAGLAPYDSYVFYALSMVLYHADRNKEALAAIQEALRIDPEDADHYKMLSKIYVDMDDWNRALEAARQGLALDPENVECANLEAMALVHLGRQNEAGTVIESALRKDPENTQTHANLGWLDLHAGKHQDALVHFREALRLNPNNEYARRGIIEAMKARNILYRPILAYFLWMSRLSGQVRWGLLVGLWLLVRVLRSAAQANPDLNAIVFPLLGAYILFALMSWIANPLFNLFLRLDKFGRLALSEEETRASTWIGICFFGGLAVALLGLVARSLPLGLTGVGLFAMSIPVAGIFRGSSRKSRLILTIYTVILAVVGLLAAGVGLVSAEMGAALGALFLIGWVLYSWIASFVINL